MFYGILFKPITSAIKNCVYMYLAELTNDETFVK